MQQSYVSSVTELQLLLMAFGNADREIDIQEFSEWCMREKNKQLNKRSLGLNPNLPFYKGLCDKHPEKFRYRTDGDTIFLIFR